MVINYDFPSGKTSGVEDYVHRIGRTARGENTGIAHTFLTQQDHRHAPVIVDILTRCGQVCIVYDEYIVISMFVCMYDVMQFFTL